VRKPPPPPLGGAPHPTPPQGWGSPPRLTLDLAPTPKWEAQYGEDSKHNNSTNRTDSTDCHHGTPWLLAPWEVAQDRGGPRPGADETRLDTPMLGRFAGPAPLRLVLCACIRLVLNERLAFQQCTPPGPALLTPPGTPPANRRTPVQSQSQTPAAPQAAPPSPQPPPRGPQPPTAARPAGRRGPAMPPPCVPGTHCSSGVLQLPASIPRAPGPLACGLRLASVS
jgi:hypothetical protein